MHYTVTVYKNNKVIETHYFESHFLARVERHRLELKFPKKIYDIRIEEV